MLGRLTIALSLFRKEIEAASPEVFLHDWWQLFYEVQLWTTCHSSYNKVQSEYVQ